MAKPETLAPFDFNNVLAIAVRRLWANRGLTLSLLLGWTVAIGLALSVPLYADAVSHRLLGERLANTSSEDPAFAFRFRYDAQPLEWADVQPVSTYFHGGVAEEIGLPLELSIRYIRTDTFGLFANLQTAYEDPNRPLAWISLVTLSDVAEHVEVLEGAFPGPELPADEGLDVLIHEELASEMGLQVGEDYMLYRQRVTSAEGGGRVQIPVRIAGVWREADPESGYWFKGPVLDSGFLVPEVSFRDRVAPTLTGEVYRAIWYVLLDGSNVRAENVGSLLYRTTSAVTRAAILLPRVVLGVSPVEALRKYRSDTYLLTIVLSVFTVPVIGLILYFVASVAGMAIRRQQTEIAVVRSRGMSRWQVLAVYVLEGLLIGAVALALGVLLGQVIAALMSRTASFLRVSSRPPLPVRLSWGSLRFALGAAVLALLANVLPALSTTGHTIVTRKQEQARTLRRPAWQRYYLDFLLLVPAAYGYYMLRQRGTISVNLLGGGTADPFQNPLLFLVPSLAALSLGLIFVRLFPLIAAALAALFAWLPGAPTVLVLRDLARSSSRYTGPVLALVLTTALASFTASMAVTLDTHLADRTYYQVGADLNMYEWAQSTDEAQGAAQAADGEALGPLWSFLPVGEHLRVDGVRAAARVGQYDARTLDTRQVEDVTFVGVDRLDFAQVGFFRPDFSANSLGALMNALALDPRAVLVERGFLTRHSLRVGDPFRLNLLTGSKHHPVDFIVGGVLDLFPTLYPEDGAFVVGSLDYAFREMGNQYRYDVWLATDVERPAEAIASDLEQIGFHIAWYQDARELILLEQTRPTRQGVLGMLSMGFLASAGLTVLVFVLHGIFSFRERFIELGVLRAIGLSIVQMAVFLAGEQLALVLTGATVGTALGVWFSQLFIPFLQVGGGPHSHTPPFVVQVAWADISRIYGIFGAMLLVAVSVTLVLLARMRIFEAVKLGEVV